MRRSNDLAIDDHERTDRHIIMFKGSGRFGESEGHQLGVVHAVTLLPATTAAESWLMWRKPKGKVALREGCLDIGNDCSDLVGAELVGEPEGHRMPIRELRDHS